ncbi:glycosyltransferase family 32 protein [Bacteroides sp.]|uniref:glycosyltransferase family 32 protein n=1 Tax=Bacteroides sp. TaxID=29523 RepID=UPI0026200EA9|nr:glycosyltransferase [Bacteroides sp.]MDD3038884.1 glycosyltransferase [Bacteroides sp.]
MIPKNIHLIFLRKDEPFPELFEKCKQKIQENHLGWNIRLYNKDDAENILTQYLPEYINIYNSFCYNVQKADFLRIVLVYLFGGFYMDLDMLSLKPLDELRKYSLILGEEKTVCQSEQEALNLRYQLRIANYMFGGMPKHPFLLKMMDEMAKRAMVVLKSQQEILDITGPGLMTDIYWDNYSMYSDITLLRNTDKRCKQPYHNEVSCHFGDYAAHLHAGTWRKSI